MNSDKPKALQQLGGKPILAHLLETSFAINPMQVHVVIGTGAALVKSTFANDQVNWVLQAEQKGTGHAMMQAIDQIGSTSKVMILLGDAPLLRFETMLELLATECDLAVLTVDQQNPHNYGRIIRDGERLVQIVEECDANEQQQKICEINTGVMVADASSLQGWLNQLDTNNTQGEYLLTDIVEIANTEGAVVKPVKASDAQEVQGVNTFSQLAALESYYQKRITDRLMTEGCHLVDPTRVNIRGNLTVGRDVSIDINCIFEGEVILGDNVSIGANCILRDTSIGNDCIIKPDTIIEGALIRDECSVGPFARIRPGTELEDQVAVGNFVEIKKSTLGKGTKSSHLTYLGDATIGAGVNIGAGTITCNYDGVHKHHTEIGDNVFVGSNTAFVAPVTIGEGSTIAAGSTITKQVVDKTLAIARGRQKNLANWKGPRDK